MNRSRAFSRAVLPHQTCIWCSVALHKCKRRAWMGNVWKGISWGHQCSVGETILLEKKKSRKIPLPFHSMSHILLFIGAFYNLHYYVLGLAENERRAWGSRFQLVCHIQGSFCDRNFPKFLDLTVLLIYLGNNLPGLWTCCRSRGLRAFLSLLLVKTLPLWAKSCIFPVKINFGQWSFRALSENLCL